MSYDLKKKNENYRDHIQLIGNVHAMDVDTVVVI